jgi:hypothetical protein
MAVERVGVGHREVEAERLAGDLDVEPVAAPQRRRALLEHPDGALGRLIVVHRNAGALEERPAMLGDHRLELGRRLRPRGDLDHAAPRGPMAPISASSSSIGAMVEGIGTPPKPEWLSE